jgi:hypothetical protein
MFIVRTQSSIKTPSPPKANADSSPSTDPPAIATTAAGALTADDEKAPVVPVPVVPTSTVTAAAPSVTATRGDAAETPPQPPAAVATGGEVNSKPEPLSAPPAAAEASPAGEPAVVVMATPEVEAGEAGGELGAEATAGAAAAAPVPGRSPMAEALIRVLSSQEHRAKGVVDPSVLEGAAEESSLPNSSSSSSYANGSFSPGGGASPVKGGAPGADGSDVPSEQEPMHALMEGDDTSSGEEDGEEGEWGGVMSGSSGGGGGSSAGASSSSSLSSAETSGGAATGGAKRTGTGKDEVLPADFDHELVCVLILHGLHDSVLYSLLPTKGTTPASALLI